ncbi:MAG: hypothetical protein KKH98_15615, partial [Spirochaetes bacterium]|nr:hypothetical protein [Spirochaetota bacterium]
MKNRSLKELTVLIFLLVLCPFVIFALPVTSLEPGTKNVSLGLTGVSFYADVNSSFYNPSLLLVPDYDSFNAEYSYNDSKLFNSLNLSYVRKAFRNIALGISYRYYKPPVTTVMDADSGILKDSGQVIQVFNTSGAFKINKLLHAGANIKAINNETDTDQYSSVSMDAGLLYMPYNFIKGFNIGLTFMNLVRTTGELDGEEVDEPLNIKTGVSYLMGSKAHSLL